MLRVVLCCDFFKRNVVAPLIPPKTIIKKYPAFCHAGQTCRAAFRIHNRKHLPFQRKFPKSVLLFCPEMQFRFPTELSAEEYVRKEAWKNVTVRRCPIHPDSDCRLARHGTYRRVIPEGTKIPRILCLAEHITFSLLPDCFASRLPGTLADVESVVLMVETAVRNSGHDELTMTTAKETLTSPDLAAVVGESVADGRVFEADFRWLKRRVEYVLSVLSVVADLFPETFGNCPPTLAAFRLVCGGGPVLVRLRAVAESRIHEIPAPLGLNPGFSGPQDLVCKPP